MKTVKTIQQFETVYTVSQFGNRSFRVAFARKGETRVHHIDKVFDTIGDVEEYIHTCANADKLIATICK